MALHGGFADTQAGAYFFIALTANNKFEDLHLPAGQIRTGHTLDQSLGDGCRNVAPAGVDGPDCHFEFFEEHILQQIASGSCLQ